VAPKRAVVFLSRFNPLLLYGSGLISSNSFPYCASPPFLKVFSYQWRQVFFVYDRIVIPSAYGRDHTGKYSTAFLRSAKIKNTLLVIAFLRFGGS